MKLTGELLKHVSARCSADRDWTVDKWDAIDNAIVAVRLTLEMMGCKDELGADFAGDRQTTVEALLQLFKSGAPINFFRDCIVDSGLAPKQEAKPASKSGKLASA